MYRHYHDDEWGRPMADDHRLFEKVALEGFMSGLSWGTILRKRENFRRAFRDFDPQLVARFGTRDVTRLMGDAGIVRNRAKIEATINNAQRHADIVREFGSFPAYVWRFEPKRRPEGMLPEAVAMSKDLRNRGWSFVGPTTVLSFMQAMGLVNDHLTGCEVRAAAAAARDGFERP